MQALKREMGSWRRTCKIEQHISGKVGFSLFGSLSLGCLDSLLMHSRNRPYHQHSSPFSFNKSDSQQAQHINKADRTLVERNAYVSRTVERSLETVLGQNEVTTRVNPSRCLGSQCALLWLNMSASCEGEREGAERARHTDWRKERAKRENHAFTIENTKNLSPCFHCFLVT